MEKVVELLQCMRKEGGYYHGHVDGEENLEALFEKFRQVSGMYFPTVNSRSRENDGGSHFSVARPLFSLSGKYINIEFSGMPFTSEATTDKTCMFGKDTNAKSKQKKKDRAALQPMVYNEHGYNAVSSKKKKPRHQVTKKKDCPAQLVVKEVTMYPGYSLDETFNLASTRKQKEMKQNKLNLLTSALKQGQVVTSFKRFYVKLPSNEAHQNHAVGNLGDLLAQPIHEKVKDKIYDLVAEGMVNPRLIKLVLRDYVDNVLLVDDDIQVDQCNNSYYPELQTIGDHVRLALRVQRFGKLDQQALSDLVDEWKLSDPDRSVFFRPQPEENKDENPFLFVHQEQWQKRLLHRYGQHLIFLDATYKTTKYALPLFFLAVQTNAGYLPVAEFILYHETKECIKEALDILKSWNPDWKPPYGMTDYDDAEISALEEAFPGIHVYICEFHREQAWTRWVRKGENGLKATEQPQLLYFLRNIASSQTSVDLARHKQQLEKSVLWQQKANLREYVTSQWLKCERRWVKCFRNPLFDRCVSTNNGVEALNKVLKHNYLKYFCDRSVTGLISMLVKTFLPDRYKQYIKINHKMTDQYSKYTEYTPDYLKDRPLEFIKHMEDRKTKGSVIPKSDITFISSDKFLVKSQLDGTQSYEVDLSVPKCGCHDFFRTNWPCKHMHAIFTHYPKSGWDSLREGYKNSPFLTVDLEVLKLTSLQQPIAFQQTNPSSLPVAPLVESLSVDTEGAEQSSPVEIEQDDDSLIRKKQEQLRILLKKSVDRSFMCNNLERLNSGIDYCLKMISTLEKGCNTADNMLLLSDEVPKHLQGKLLRKRKQDKQPAGIDIGNKFGKLPPYKKPGNVQHWKVRGRVGKRADIYKTNYKCKLNLTGITTAKKVVRKYTRKAQPKATNRKPITIKKSLNPVTAQSAPIKIPTAPVPKKLKLSPTIDTSNNNATNHHNLLFDPRATLFQYGSTNISWYQLMSIENPTSLTPSDISIINQVPDASFRAGWLYDCIVDSYLSLQTLLHKSLFCESTTFLSMRFPKASPDWLWRDANGENMDFKKHNIVIAPYNINRNHWILFIANLREEVLYVLDPMKQTASGADIAENILLFIIESKTGIKCIVNRSKPHVLQADSFNCGVFVCYYAESYLQGKPLTAPFSVLRLRRKIKEVLAGSCVDDIKTQGRNLEVCKSCKQAVNLNVRCIRCNQGYHDKCVTRSSTGNYFCQK